MSSFISSTFKVKPLSFYTASTSWPSPPRFPPSSSSSATTSLSQEDVETWLQEVKRGCKERDIPKDLWARVGEEFMSQETKRRLEEVKNVMDRMHGGEGNYRWTWKRFKVAMVNMGWEIDTMKKEAVQIGNWTNGPLSLLFWWTKNSSGSVPAESQENERPKSLVRAETSFWSSRNDTGHQQKCECPEGKEERPDLARAATDFLFGGSSNSNSLREEQRTGPRRTNSDTLVSRDTVSNDKPLPANVQAPTWLLNVVQALDTFQSKLSDVSHLPREGQSRNVDANTKVMSALSAILITAGTLSLGPTGGLAAHGVAHGVVQAAGAVAVGVGAWLRDQGQGEPGAKNEIEK